MAQQGWKIESILQSLWAVQQTGECPFQWLSWSNYLQVLLLLLPVSWPGLRVFFTGWFVYEVFIVSIILGISGPSKIGQFQELPEGVLVGYLLSSGAFLQHGMFQSQRKLLHDPSQDKSPPFPRNSLCYILLKSISSFNLQCCLGPHQFSSLSPKMTCFQRESHKVDWTLFYRFFIF